MNARRASPRSSLAAVGFAGIDDWDRTQIDLYLDDVQVAPRGRRFPAYCEEDGQRAMQQSEITVRVNLERGVETSTVWTCDLSEDCVKTRFLNTASCSSMEA